MEEKKVTFEEKLTQLLELAKTKKNVLDNKEILNYFHGEILSPEQLDRIYDFLENHHFRKNNRKILDLQVQRAI